MASQTFIIPQFQDPNERKQKTQLIIQLLIIIFFEQKLPINQIILNTTLVKTQFILLHIFKIKNQFQKIIIYCSQIPYGGYLNIFIGLKIKTKKLMHTNSPPKRLYSAKSNRIKTLPASNELFYSRQKPANFQSRLKTTSSEQHGINWKNIKQSLASNPDIYFKPQVKKQAYICVIDKYLSKKSLYHKKGKPSTPIKFYANDLNDDDPLGDLHTGQEKKFSSKETQKQRDRKNMTVGNKQFIKVKQHEHTFTSSLLLQKHKNYSKQYCFKSQSIFQEKSPQTESKSKLPIIEETDLLQAPKYKVKRSITMNYYEQDNPEGIKKVHQANLSNRGKGKRNHTQVEEGSIGEDECQSILSLVESELWMDHPSKYPKNSENVRNFQQQEPSPKGQAQINLNLRKTHEKRLLALLFQKQFPNTIYTIEVQTKTKGISKTFTQGFRQSIKKSYHNYKSKKTMKSNFAISQPQSLQNKQEKVQFKRYHLHTNMEQEELIQKMVTAMEKVSDLKIPMFWKAQSGWRGYFQAPVKKSLRNQLFSFTYDRKNLDNNIIRVTPKKAYYKLFENDCQHFCDLIRSITQQLLQVKSKVINNSISLDNIYFVGEKDVKIGEWGCSAIKRTMDIGGKHVELTDDPILTDSEGWMINPENLPPQVVENIGLGKYTKIWEQNPMTEVWCIGLMIFQIISMVPIWTPFLTASGHRTPRKGLFHEKNRKLDAIRQAQNKFPFYLSKWLREEKQKLKLVKPQILTIMKESLQIKISQRISFQQILDLLVEH